MPNGSTRLVNCGKHVKNEMARKRRSYRRRLGPVPRSEQGTCKSGVHLRAKFMDGVSDHGLILKL